PDRRLKTARADLFEHSLNVSAESAAGFQPVTHGGLITIVDLNVFEAGRTLRNEVEIVEHLLGRDARTEAIPGALPCRRILPAQGRMILNKPLRQFRQQLLALHSAPECEFFQFPCFSGRKLAVFCIDDGLQRSPAQVELAAEPAARSESHQLCGTL